jgi:peptidoglycan/xylan/chitin deacetylase (PgdA/CDA1 family)
MTPPPATQGVTSSGATTPQSVPILLYHSISAEATAAYRPFAVAPTVFAAQMRHLSENGYTTLTVSQWMALRRSGAVLPTRPVLITFDDAFRDVYTDALPILQQYGFRATLYIVSGYVGGTSVWLRGMGEGDRPLLGWREICECQAAGIECGAHSETHAELDAIPSILARDEITLSKETIEDSLSTGVRTFAYPHGYHDRVARAFVAEAGYESACAVKNAMSSTVDDPFALARITITADIDLSEFARAVRGEGVAPARQSERVQTRVWRAVRRARRRAAGPRLDTASV